MGGEILVELGEVELGFDVFEGKRLVELVARIVVGVVADGVGHLLDELPSVVHILEVELVCLAGCGSSGNYLDEGHLGHPPAELPVHRVFHFGLGLDDFLNGWLRCFWERVWLLDGDRLGLLWVDQTVEGLDDVFLVLGVPDFALGLIVGVHLFFFFLALDLIVHEVHLCFLLAERVDELLIHHFGEGLEVGVRFGLVHTDERVRRHEERLEERVLRLLIHQLGLWVLSFLGDGRNQRGGCVEHGDVFLELGDELVDWLHDSLDPGGGVAFGDVLEVKQRADLVQLVDCLLLAVIFAEILGHDLLKVLDRLVEHLTEVVELQDFFAQ